MVHACESYLDARVVDVLHDGGPVEVGGTLVELDVAVNGGGVNEGVACESMLNMRNEQKNIVFCSYLACCVNKLAFLFIYRVNQADTLFIFVRLRHNIT